MKMTCTVVTPMVCFVQHQWKVTNMKVINTEKNMFQSTIYCRKNWRKIKLSKIIFVPCAEWPLDVRDLHN